MLFCHLKANWPSGLFCKCRNSPNLMLTQTLTLILTLIPTIILTQTEEKDYFASGGKIATFYYYYCYILPQQL